MRRYDRELSLEIDRTVRRFNAKIKRLERTERELDLPEPIERTDIVTYRSTKNTIQKRLKEYQKFLERGAEDVVTTEGGVRISKYELNQIKQRQRTSKATLTRQIKHLQNVKPKIAGQETYGTFESMGDPYYYGLVARRKALDKDVESLNKQQLNRLKGLTSKVLGKRETDLILKENYLDMLIKNAYSFGIDKRKADLLKDRLNKLSPNDFVKLYNKDKAIKAMFEYYLQSKDIKSEEGYKYLQNSAEDLFDEIINNIDEILEEYE